MWKQTNGLVWKSGLGVFDGREAVKQPNEAYSVAELAQTFQVAVLERNPGKSWAEIRQINGKSRPGAGKEGGGAVATGGRAGGASTSNSSRCSAAMFAVRGYVRSTNTTYNHIATQKVQKTSGRKTISGIDTKTSGNRVCVAQPWRQHGIKNAWLSSIEATDFHESPSSSLPHPICIKIKKYSYFF